MGKVRSKAKRPDATGRVDTSRFVRLDHKILNSPAYRALSPNARALLVELAMLDNGANNGSLYLSVRDAAARIGVADLTAANNAFDDLQRLGFIEMTEASHFHVKASEASRARCWRLTWLAGPGRKAPSWDFLNREPDPQTRERKRMERGLRALKVYRKARDSNKLPVLDFDTIPTMRPDIQPRPVLVSNTRELENSGFPPKSRVLDFATHTAVTMGDGGPEPPSGHHSATVLWNTSAWAQAILAEVA